MSPHELAAEINRLADSMTEGQPVLPSTQHRLDELLLALIQSRAVYTTNRHGRITILQSREINQ